MRQINAQGLALLTRLQAGERIPIVRLIELMFSIPERYCTAGSALTWNGSAWIPLGLQIEPVEDKLGEFPALTLSMPAISPAQISLALTQPVAGTGVHIYEALVDPDTGAVADAVLSWSGELDVPGVEDGPQAVISVLAEHRGTIATRNRPSRYTDDEQQRLYPGDTSLKFDPALDAAPLTWPAASFFKR